MLLLFYPVEVPILDLAAVLRQHWILLAYQGWLFLKRAIPLVFYGWWRYRFTLIFPGDFDQLITTDGIFNIAIFVLSARNLVTRFACAKTD